MSIIKRKAGSKDIVKSVLEFDAVPTEGSPNLVESGAVAQAIGNLGQPLQWKGPATVSELNAGITGIQPGWTYTLTDAGTLTDGSIDVEAGDEVAWTEDGEWFQVGPSLVELKADVAQAKADIADVQDAIPEEASDTNKLVTKDELDNVQESIQSGFTPKGEISVFDLNDLTTQSNGDQYILTDSGTITDGSVAVDAGDSVAWNSTDSVWYKVNQYALSKYGTDEIKNLPITITAFRTGDVIPVDGPSGTANMSKDDLLRETAKNSLEANKATIFDESVYFVDIYPMATIGYYIASNQGVGQTIDYTPVSNAQLSFVVYPCRKGQSFHIVGSGGSTPRLWCFVDASDKVLSVAEESTTAYTPGIEVTAPADGKLIVNTFKTLGTGDPTPSVFVRLKTTDEINHVKDKTFIYEDVFIVDGTNTNKYITTNGNVGTTIDYTPVTGSSYAFGVFDCKRLDTFKIKGRGANAPRLWCFVDSSDKIVCNSASSATTGDGEITLTAPVDGKLIVNLVYSAAHYVKKEIAVSGKVADIETKVSENKTDIAALNNQASMWKDLFQPNAQQRYYIQTNLNVGDTVSLVPVSIANYSFLVLDCSAGDVFKVRGTGGDAPRLWCFVDASDKVLSVAASSASTGADYITLVAEQNGKLIINSITAPPSGNEPNVLVLQTCQDAKKELADKVDYFVKSELPVDYTPYEEVNDVLADVSTSSDQVIFDIYDAMDALITANPSMITKYDAATLTDLTYPRYANGISSGDPDYLETPAYKVYAYKISSHTDRGNQFALPKKKLLLVSGVHGPEHRACINTLAFINHLVNNPSDDIFGLLSRVEFWFVPCVNGYGIIHATRTNANGVDINRSFGTKYWQVEDNPGDSTYSGATPDTEFETLLIEGMYNYVKPDFFVDHHCTPTPGAAQFYTESPSYNVLLRSMKAVTEISRFDIKNFPTDFGTKFQLFVGTNPLQVPNGLQKHAGMGDVWFYEHGVEAATIEMFGYINYENGGQVDPTGHRGNDYWKVMEYILRNQLCNYLQIVL